MKKEDILQFFKANSEKTFVEMNLVEQMNVHKEDIPAMFN